MSDPRPIGVFDSGVGGLTVLREILRRLPFESTVYLGDNARAPYGIRDRRRGPALQRSGPRCAGPARREGARRGLQHFDVGRPRRFPAALRPAGPRRRSARGGSRRAGHAKQARRRDSHSRHRSVAGVLQRDQGRESRRRGLRARHAQPRAARRGRPPDRTRCRDGRQAGRSRRSWASAMETATSSSRCRPRRGSTRCCWAALTTRCLSASCATASVTPWPSSTRPRRRPRHWQSCSPSTPSKRPARRAARLPTRGWPGTSRRTRPCWRRLTAS